MYGEAVAPPAAGRSWEAPRSSRVSDPVITLKGRPEDNSISGAIVKLLRKACMNPSPCVCGEVWKTPLVTQRWRWSLTELARSRNGKRESGGSGVDCRSVASSMECDQV